MWPNARVSVMGGEQAARVLDQISTTLDGAAGRAGALVDGALRDAWQQGEDLVDKPLAVIGHQVELVLPLLDTRVLSSFSGGVYLRWTVTGSVRFEVTRLSGVNAVVSAVFIN